MYERQHGSGFEIGSYAHRAILMDADDIPSIAASALSPTMLPFTAEDFDPQLEDALELFPEIVGDESVGQKLAINGLLSLTPGRQPDHRRDAGGQGALVRRRDLDQGGARDRAVCRAEWMTHGTPEIDPHGSDIARFYDHHKTAQHIAARTTEGYNKTYGIVHPMEQWASNRPIRLSPAYDRHVELGAEFFEAAGWERPFWYGTNEALLGEYGDRVMPRAAEWESRWWSPIINAEHLAMRDRVGLVDLSAFALFDVTGPGALAALERLVRQQGGRAGRADRLHAAAQRGRRDPRRPHDHAAGPRPVPGRDRRRDGHARPEDLPGRDAGRRLGAAPRRHERLHDVRAVGSAGAGHPGRGVRRPTDISHAGFPFLSTKAVDIDGVRTLASRISYVGELGWEIYVPIEQGLRVWDALWRAGRPHGLVAGRDRHVRGHVAAREGLSRPRRRAGARLQPRRGGDGPADAQGRGLRRPRRPTSGSEPAPPAAVLCTLTVDDPTSSSGVKRYMLGREPILTPRRCAARRRQGPPLVRDQRRLGAIGRASTC